MKSQLLLFQREPDSKEIIWIREKFPVSETLIYRDGGLGEIQELIEYDQEQFIMDPALKSRINKMSFERILNFGDTVTSLKFSHSHLLNYQHLNLWYYNKFRTYFWLRNGLYQREKLKYLLKEFNRITAFIDSGETEKWAKLNGVDVIVTEKKQKKTSWSTSIAFLLKFVFRAILNGFLSFNPTNKVLVLSPTERLQDLIGIDSLKMERNDPFFGYLLSKFKKDLVLLDEMKFPEQDVKTKSYLIPSHYEHFVLGEGIMLMGTLNPRLWKEWRILKNKFKRILQNMEAFDLDENHREIIVYLQKHQKSHNFFIFRYLAYRNYFSRKKVRAVLATDENSMFTKVVLDAAKATDTLTIGMQHGNIHSLHPAYMFTKKDIELHPMPDYTFVWGSLWKEILIKEGNYSENELIIVGQLRTDIIPKLIAENRTSNFRVVFASQPQFDLELREKAARDVFRMARDLDIDLRIKLHPRENDPDYYRNIAHSEGLKDLEFTGEEDLYEVILNSDLMITCYSTVGAETAYFKKPLIILDYLKEDINKYSKDGIAFQASSVDELKTAVKKIRDEGLKIDEKVYEDYIANCAYKIDGKVAHRMIDWLRHVHVITSHNVE